MIQYDDYQFFNEEALLYRLTQGVANSNREIVFVVGAPLTAPSGEDTRGVANVAAVTAMIREQFNRDQSSLQAFDREVRDAANPYQSAFRFLQGRLGQDAANQIVRRAVLQAYVGVQSHTDLAHARLSDDQLKGFDEEINAWALSPGVKALGELLAAKGSPFGALAITSNFDPLIAVAIKKAGGTSWRTALHLDGDFQQSKADGCQILHIHGYWHGTDTLHTATQLLQTRTTLRNSLLSALEGKTVVVMAYGGWEDIFTSSLESMIGNANNFPEVIWTFYEAVPNVSDRLKGILLPGIARGRVNFYSNIDCHSILPKISEFWSQQNQQAPFDQPVKTALGINKTKPRFDLKGLECDRPPGVDVWVGREPELRSLETTDAKVVVICGFGGQGKSHLAAKYLKSVDDGETEFQHWDWRDCKEEGDRIRTQLIAAIERIARVSEFDLQIDAMTDADLVDLFVRISSTQRLVFIFDNVDHYVDLEKHKFFGILDVLLQNFSRSTTNSRIILTCRPQIKYNSTSISSFTLSGLSLGEAVSLFNERVGQDKVSASDIGIAHEITAGHPIWLDMMAVRVARVPGMTLAKLNEDIRRDRSDNPDILSTIWNTLADREQIVLRVMSEAKRPESMEMIERFVGSRLNYNKFSRAMRSLIALNLIIVKPERNSPDLYDLHPLVRTFVRKNFDRPERKSFIQIVINEYISVITGIESMLGVHLPFPLLERWSQKAELEIEAGLYKDAFATLAKADDALIGGGHSEEFVRVSGKLFEAIDWLSASSQIALFDDVISSYIFALEQLERYQDTDLMLDKYNITMASKSARYIKFLNVKAHTLWQRGKIHDAIELAKEGVELKTQTGVDTEFDCGHTLALAQRDGGAPDEALPFFLKTYTLEKILSDDGIADVDDPTTLGNVGRCLQMMGRFKDALHCFRKSAQLLESNNSLHRLSNQTYARHWIAQALMELGNEELAYCFFIEAEELAGKFAPGRLRIIASEKEQKFPASNLNAIPRNEISKRVQNWIAGRSRLC